MSMNTLREFKDSLPKDMPESTKILITGAAEMLVIYAFYAGRDIKGAGGKSIDIVWENPDCNDYLKSIR